MGEHRASKFRRNGLTGYTLFVGADESVVHLDTGEGRRDGECVLELVTALITSDPHPDRKYHRNFRESDDELPYFENKWMNGNGLYTPETARFAVIIGDKKPLKTGCGSNFRIALPRLLRHYCDGLERAIWKVQAYLDGKVTSGNVQELELSLNRTELEAWNFVKNGHRPKTELDDESLYRALELVIGADAIGRILNRRIAQVSRHPREFIQTLADERMAGIWIDGVEIDKSCLELEYYERRGLIMTHKEFIQRCRQARREAE